MAGGAASSSFEGEPPSMATSGEAVQEIRETQHGQHHSREDHQTVIVALILPVRSADMSDGCCQRHNDLPYQEFVRARAASARVPDWASPPGGGLAPGRVPGARRAPGKRTSAPGAEVGWRPGRGFWPDGRDLGSGVGSACANRHICAESAYLSQGRACLTAYHVARMGACPAAPDLGGFTRALIGLGYE